MKKVYLMLLSIIAVSLLTFFILIPVFSGRMQIDPVIHLGVLQIHWYGLILAAAILTAYFVARKNSWKFGIGLGDVDDYAFWVTIVGVLGARLYYVIFNYNYFFQNPQEIYRIWHGGLAIYGAVLSGLVFTYLYSRKKAYTFWQLADLVGVALPLGQAIGRFGNFVNQEAFGLPTNLPWKMFVLPTHRPEQFRQMEFFHPTFLYEALLDLLIFGILYKLLGRVKNGMLALGYLIAYSLGRFFIEGIRLDSFYVVGFKVDQVVAFLIIVLAGFYALRRQSKLVS
ncbi:MAG: prolipoprotein diacylglyceryl transferase [Candidatus Doudnabacteria bacterium]|nr:prolipoprotein diacylglyceryl transferase [Candidatus Doudnabacteria bacterium]